MNIFKKDFIKFVLEKNPDQKIIRNFDYICAFIPEIKKMQNFDQNNPYHIYDVLNHTLIVLRNTPQDLTLRLSALFHDIGKPLCYTVDNEGIGHFYGHNIVGIKLASDILNRLEFDEKIINDVIKLVEYHDYPLYLQKKSLTKLINKISPELISHLLILKRADIKGQNPRFLDRLNFIDEVELLLKECI